VKGPVNDSRSRSAKHLPPGNRRDAFWLRSLRTLWAGPYTLLGFALGLLALFTGGGIQRIDGVWEFYGGWLVWALNRLPLHNVQAMTLGQTVIGRSLEALDATRAHERIHVRQYERWGPLLGPAYLGCCLVLWCQGRDAYRDNPFEREAYGDR
jgi:hypothetical protein